MRLKLSKLHGLFVADIDTILADMARHAIVLNPVQNATALLAPDAGDQFLWNLLATRADLLLVSGDKLLLKNQAISPRVMTPQAFIARWQH